jgi:hypothetical protein
MAKTGIRHIAEKSADIIDPVQIENSKNKTNKSNVQKSEKEKIEKIETTISTKFAKGYIIRMHICTVKPAPKMHPSF